MVRILMNVRFGSIAAFHEFYLNVRFQWRPQLIVATLYLKRSKRWSVEDETKKTKIL